MLLSLEIADVLYAGDELAGLQQGVGVIQAQALCRDINVDALAADIAAVMHPDAGLSDEIGMIISDLEVIRGERLSVRGILDGDLSNNSRAPIGERKRVARDKFH